jgi:hypothetical protein
MVYQLGAAVDAFAAARITLAGVPRPLYAFLT